MAKRFSRFSAAPFVLLAAAILAELAYEGLAKQNQLRQRAMHAYRSALGDTRASLASLVHEAAEDPTLLQNFAWKLKHSVERQLLGALSHGQLEQLAVFDADCQELARASVQKLPLAPCRPVAGSEGFSWSATEAALPLLTLVRRVAISEGKTLLFQGQVSLGADWLLLFPALKSLKRTLGLTLAPSDRAPPRGVLLLSDGLQSTGTYAASLYSSDWLLRYAGRLMAAPQLVRTLFFWPLLAAVMLLLSIHLLFNRRNEYQLAAGEGALLEQCRHLYAFEGAALRYDVRADPRFFAMPHSRAVLETLVAGIRAQFGKDERLLEEKQLLERQLGKLKAQCASLERRASETAEHESLALQLKQSSLGLMARLDKQAEAEKSISQFFRGTLLRDCRSLLAFVERWEQGLAAAGSRKFIRSLCETPSARAPASDNRLDDELVDLGRLGSRMLDGMLYICKLLGDFSQDQARAQQVLAHWYGLALRENSEAREGSRANLAELLAQADNLRLASGEASPLAVKVSSLGEEEGMLTALPEPVMLAVLYHILAALAPLPERGQVQGQGREERLAVHTSRVGDEALLLFSISTPPGRQGARERAVHLERANRLLEAYGFTFQAFAAGEEPDTFVLRRKSVHHSTHAAPPTRVQAI